MTPTVDAPTLADPVSQSPRSAGERALDHFLAAGFERTEPPILHPAALFLDMSGEEVRRRLFLTADAAGEEMCLRPEYTIPVCRAYLASDRAGGIAEYSYLGPVFRARAGQDGEQTQTGLESFGRKDAEAADAEVFALSLEAATAAGGGALAARVGDAGLFERCCSRSRFPTSGGGVCAAASPAGGASTPSSAARARARRRKRACWRRSKAPTTRGPRRWLRTSWRSPASRRSAGAAPARSPTGSSNRRRCGRASRSRPRSGRCSRLSWRFPAIPTRRRSRFGAWLGPPGSTSPPRSTPSRCATASSPRAGANRRDPLQRRLRARLRLLHRLRVRGA